jgi:hypothetical protein
MGRDYVLNGSRNNDLRVDFIESLKRHIPYPIYVFIYINCTFIFISDSWGRKKSHWADMGCGSKMLRNTDTYRCNGLFILCF